MVASPIKIQTILIKVIVLNFFRFSKTGAAWDGLVYKNSTDTTIRFKFTFVKNGLICLRTCRFLETIKVNADIRFDRIGD